MDSLCKSPVNRHVKLPLLLMSILMILSACTDTPVDTFSDIASMKNTRDFKSISIIETLNTQKQDVVKREDINQEYLEEISANEAGEIMIIMYHGIVEANPPSSFQRTEADLYNDLQTLYERGYRLIPLSDIINNTIDIEAGKTPVALTFDDGLSSEFSFTEENGELVPTKGSAVDIINRFTDEFPDFGKAATFYINREPFTGAGTTEERFRYLIENGYDIGNHTATHPVLRDCDANTVEAEIGEIDKLIRDILPDYTPDGIAYPHGVRPVEDMRHLASTGTYENHVYENNIGLAVGQNGLSANPNHIDFEDMWVPRTRASDDDPNGTDLWGLLRKYEESPDLRYISDGNPDTISVPTSHEDKINLETIKANEKELIVY